MLTTDEVARRLGVKPTTVYAYVSRGLLKRLRNADGKASLFDEADVDAFEAGRRQAATPPTRTRITLIGEDGRLYFRGRDALTLSVTHPFESVALLLWASVSGDFKFSAPGDLVALAEAVTEPLPASARLTDRLRVIVAAAASADPLRFDTSMTAVITTGQAIIATMVAALPLRGELNPTVLLNNYEPGMPEARSISDMLNAAVPLDLEKGEIGRPIQRRDTVAAALWSRLTAYPPTRQTLELLNAAMILLADHDMAASTLAARVAASTRAHPYAVVSAGLAALDGPLHGAASGLSYELIADALRTGDPVRIVSDRLRTGGVLPGFGHALYPSGDPRATALLALLRVVGPSATMDLVDNLIKASGRRPNIDFAVAALALAYEMPVDAGEAIFAIARTAGWIAHSLEEYSDRPSRFRPSGLYAGQRPIV